MDELLRFKTQAISELRASVSEKKAELERILEEFENLEGDEKLHYEAYFTAEAAAANAAVAETLLDAAVDAVEEGNLPLAAALVEEAGRALKETDAELAAKVLAVAATLPRPGRLERRIAVTMRLAGRRTAFGLT